MSRTVHFIGVGGSGMSAVARLTAAAGATVTGSDPRESAYFLALRAAGMDVRTGHDPSNVDGADVVVISSAVRESNVELARARELGIEVWHRSEALARALEGQRLVAVAGTHGKTTTSALVSHVLHACGIDASFAVGAKVLGIDGAVAGGYAGAAGIAVVEADESDGSFLRYRPEVAILTNIEADHLDHYGTYEEMLQAFHDFAASATVLVACTDDPVVVKVATAASAAGVRVISYGTRDADVIVDGSSLIADGATYALSMPMPGSHHRLNAAAAWAAATYLGADPVVAASAFASFGGTGRRYQLRGQAAGVRVIDDYAHHPTEVAALMASAREAGEGHLVVLFQPALFSRTQALAEDFAAALTVPDADIVIAAVYGDREDPIAGVSSESIRRHMTMPEGSTVRIVDDLRAAASVAAGLARPGDVIYTVGSGTVTQAPDWILAELVAGVDSDA